MVSLARLRSSRNAMARTAAVPCAWIRDLMPALISRRQFAMRAVSHAFGAGTLALFGSGCGTILHPERKGQPAGNLDWSIVALDGIGLLLFLVPGVIAFAVDFNNGSIYLPAESTSQAAQSTKSGKSKKKLVTVKTNSGRLTRDAVEHSLTMHTGRPIRLADGEYLTHPLEDLEQFWEQHDRLSVG